MVHRSLSASPKGRILRQHKVSLILCLVLLHSVAAEQLSVSELLDRYAANQEKLKSFIVRAEITYPEDLTENKTASHSSLEKNIVELRYEGDADGFCAYFCPKFVHSAEDGSLVQADRYNSYLWDGERYFEHHKALTLSDSRAVISSNTEYIKYTIAIVPAGPGSILGFLFGDVERIDSILRQADSITVRDELERVGSGDCYVIDAKTKHGTYTIWLDAERGYGIAKADVHKGPKDLRWGRPKDYYTHAPYDYDISMRNVRFESKEGVWVPMEADFQVEYYKGPNRELPIRLHHHKITELLLNPDHDALGSFVPDIENGTRVKIREVPGIKYTWQNGEIVSDIDEYVINEIDKMTKEIMAEGKAPPSLKAKAKKAETAPNEPAVSDNAQADTAESRPFPVLVLILIGLLIIVVFGWLVFRRIKA